MLADGFSLEFEWKFLYCYFILKFGHISSSPQVSRTRLSILAVLSNAVIWIVSTRPPTSKSSKPFFFFFLIIIEAGLLAEIRWSVCMSKSHRSLCVLFSRTGTGLCIYHLFVWSNLNFLHISQWITLPTQKHQSQLVQSLLSLSTAVFQFSSKVEVLNLLFTFLQIYSRTRLSILAVLSNAVVRRDSKVHNFANSLSDLFCGQAGQQSPQFCKFSFFLLIIIIYYYYYRHIFISFIYNLKLWNIFNKFVSV